MSLYQIRLERPPWAPWFAIEFLLVTRTRLVVDALFTFALVVLPMVAMIALLFLLSSTDPSTAVPDVADGTGMLILPP